MGVLSSPQDYENLLTAVIGSFEDLYRKTLISQEEFLARLHAAPALFPVHPFYTRMLERGEITKEGYASLLKQRLNAKTERQHQIP